MLITLAPKLFIFPLHGCENFNRSAYDLQEQAILKYRFCAVHLTASSICRHFHSYYVIELVVEGADNFSAEERIGWLLGGNDRWE